MRNSYDLTHDGPMDATPVDVEIRQEAVVDCWTAKSKDPAEEFVGFSAMDALDGIAGVLRSKHGRSKVRVVHQDEERKGPARFQR